MIGALLLATHKTPLFWVAISFVILLLLSPFVGALVGIVQDLLRERRG